MPASTPHLPCFAPRYTQDEYSPAFALTMSTRYAARTVRVMHDGQHFKLDLKYNPATQETTRTWVYTKEKVLEIDCHLYIPKAKSSGEKVCPSFLPSPLPN